jgi:hypothetical protein
MRKVSRRNGHFLLHVESSTAKPLSERNGTDDSGLHSTQLATSKISPHKNMLAGRRPKAERSRERKIKNKSETER